MRFVLAALVPVIFFLGCGKKKSNEVAGTNPQEEKNIGSNKTIEKAPLLDVDSVLPNEESNNSGSSTPKEEEDGDEEISAEVKALKEKALSGDASAQLFLGQSYQRGSGVEKNLDEAIKWLRMSAEQGNVYAPHILNKLEQNTGIKPEVKLDN
ncbi:MAG: hypothetical protein CMO73_00695 [Verrucomicrobiales bacterium]|nr:hypothetical protein [Verrucomicrobiales bacterium]|tara:strand:- start:354 stop:812 length:459 start_codon:yes stop_codon:yes gene_type:complete